MPRPRFYRLEMPRQASILDAAAREFGERGFEAASYNRIIERAGLSKGAMYYYFDDKQDLYVTVLTESIESFLGSMMHATEYQQADGFWDGMNAMWRRGLLFLATNPRAAMVSRSFMSAPRSLDDFPAIRELYERANRWMEGLVAAGQSVQAVRTDLPRDMMVKAVFAVAESMNEYSLNTIERDALVDEALETWLDTTIAQFIGLVRRMVETP